VKLLSWLLSPSKKNQAILDEIEIHREIIKQTGNAVDQLMAEFNDETGNLTCGCKEKELKPHVAFPHSKQHQCAS